MLVYSFMVKKKRVGRVELLFVVVLESKLTLNNKIVIFE